MFDTSSGFCRVVAVQKQTNMYAGISCSLKYDSNCLSLVLSLVALFRGYERS